MERPTLASKDSSPREGDKVREQRSILALDISLPFICHFLVIFTCSGHFLPEERERCMAPSGKLSLNFGFGSPPPPPPKKKKKKNSLETLKWVKKIIDSYSLQGTYLNPSNYQCVVL